eukprot:TRINITY_DN30524_c0_g1_i1.p1 TRINITY_DN30524_c0_g1~~TRINITY_DN30524_c0_g1_i1.p1  ORF type:complete len:500 (+),score=67.46 TRINITY_DN30524_c0_g1_i1:29-1528(+)
MEDSAACQPSATAPHAGNSNGEQEVAPCAETASRISESSKPEEITGEQLEHYSNLAKLATIPGLSLAFAGILEATATPFALNEISSGDGSVATKDSIFWFTAYILISTFGGLFTSQFIAYSGFWYGRKNAILIGQAGMFLCIVSKFTGLMLQWPALFLLGAAFNSLTVGLLAQFLAYITDTSTAATHKQNMGFWTAIAGLVALAAGFIFAFLYIYLSYVFAALVVLQSLISRLKCMEDVSPPPSKRVTPTRDMILQTLIPSVSYHVFMRQSRFTKCLLFAIAGGATSGGFMASAELSYLLLRYRFTEQVLAIWAALGAVTGAAAVVAIMALFRPKTIILCVFWTGPFAQALFGWAPFGWTGTIAWATVWGWLFAPALACFTVVFYGQVSAKRRHELENLANVVGRIAYLLGAGGALYYVPLWAEDYESGKHSLPAPPFLCVPVDILSVLCIYVAYGLYGNQDKYGEHLCTVVEETGDIEDTSSKKESNNTAGTDDLVWI